MELLPVVIISYFINRTAGTRHHKMFLQNQNYARFETKIKSRETTGDPPLFKTAKQGEVSMTRSPSDASRNIS